MMVQASACAIFCLLGGFMLDNKGFNLWADGYDRSVDISDEDNTYPFAGYKKYLQESTRQSVKDRGEVS